jgi:hypothetical protein
MISTENKNTIQFQLRLLPNCLLHDLEIVTVNGWESKSQYHTPLAVAKFNGKQKKIKSGYFIATPRRSETPGKLLNVMLEKNGEDHLHQLCDK